MTAPHQIYSINGVALSTLGVTDAYVTSESDEFAVSAQYEERSGQPAVYTSTTLPAHEVVAVIACPTFAVSQEVVRLFDWPENDRDQTLVVYVGDPSALILAQASVTVSSPIMAHGSVTVRLNLSDPVWRVLTTSTASHTTTHDTFDEGMAVPVRGQARVSPVVRIKGTALRTTFSTVRGWRFRKQRTVEHSGDETLWRYPLKLSIGATDALVSGSKALASGNDFRVWIDGEDVARQLIDWNTGASSVWVLMNGWKPDTPKTIDFVYGNASAGAPSTFAYPDLPANYLTDSTNAIWVYLTDETVGNAGFGLWWLSAGAGSPKADTDVPAAWRPWLMHENRDDILQRRRSFYTATGTKYHAILDAERWKEGATRYQTKGISDGVHIHHPLGMTQWRGDLRYENEAVASGGSVAVGKAVIRTRRSSADPWTTVFEKSDVQATEVTVATTDYAFAFPYPKHCYLGVVPNPAVAGEDDDQEIPQDARKSAFIRLRAKTTWRLSIDDSLLDLGSLSAEADIWDAYGNIAWNRVRNEYPYTKLAIGGNGDSGRLAMPLNNYLVLDAERRSAEEWDSTLTTKVRDVAYAVAPTKVVQYGGTTIELPTSDWFPTRPRRVVDRTAANLAFPSGITGWTEQFQHASAVVDWSASADDSDGDGGAAKGEVTANTVNNDIIVRFEATTAAARFDVVPGQKIVIVGDVRTTHLDLVPVVGAIYYTAAGAVVTSVYDTIATPPAVNTYFTKFLLDTVPATVAYLRPIVAIYSDASGVTGSCRFDNIHVDENALSVDSLDVGATVRVDWVEGMYG